MTETIKQLKQMDGYLVKNRKYWDNGVWTDIAKTLSPQRENFSDTSSHKGKRKATKIYDSSPMIYVNTFAEGLHGNLISPSMVWFVYRLPGMFRYLEEVREVKMWLQEVQNLMYYYYAESNFYSVMRQYFKYGATFGTASITLDIDRGNDKTVFYCLHPRETYIAENQYGRVDTVSRHIPMTARTIKQKFPNATYSQAVNNALRNNQYEEFTVVKMVYPNNEFDGRSISNKKMAFTSKCFEKDAPDTNSFLRDKGYDDFPFMIWRYFKGEPGPYGDSPAVFAMPEIMTLQAMRKGLLRVGEMSGNPAMNIPSEMEGFTRIKPGGMNYYGPDVNRRIYPVTSGMNYPVGIDMVKDSREILKQHYHVDMFLTMQASSSRVKTAEEVLAMKSEQAMILGASIGDLTITLDSINDYMFNLKMSTGGLPQPPAVLLQAMGGRRIPIEYMGPLAQAQKRLFETQGVMDSLQILAPLFEIFPDMADNLNSDAISKRIMNSYMYPEDLRNAPEDIRLIREGRAAQMEEEKKKVDMDRMAEFLKKFAQADKNAGGKLWDALEGVMGGGMGTAERGVGLPAIA